MPAISINQLPQDCFISIRTNPSNQDIYFYYSTQDGQSYQLNDKKMGQIVIQPSRDNPTNLIYEVVWAQTQRGFGPLLYDIAMEFVSKLTNGRGFLKSDPEAISKYAVKIWDTYYNRSDVKHKQLDSLENEITPTKLDNVNLKGAKDIYRNKWISSPLAQGYQKEIDVLNSPKIRIHETKYTINFVNI